MEQNLKMEETTEVECCEHMKEYVTALSEEALHGPARWYTQLHASYCPKCRPALKTLRETRKEE